MCFEGPAEVVGGSLFLCLGDSPTRARHRETIFPDGTAMERVTCGNRWEWNHCGTRFGAPLGLVPHGWNQDGTSWRGLWNV